MELSKNINDIKQREREEVQNVITCFLGDVGTKFIKETDIAMTLLARDWKGLGTYCSNAVIEETYEDE